MQNKDLNNISVDLSATELHAVIAAIRTELSAISEPSYAAFTAKLIPTIDAARLLGVRMPTLRKFARTLGKEGRAFAILNADLPHRYHEEDLLHALLINNIKDFESCVLALEHFLPAVNNWAVCDALSPKVFKKKRQELRMRINAWLASAHVYTCRFAIKMLMEHFLGETFTPDILQQVVSIRSDRFVEPYYVQMMQAWFFATALPKQWDAALPFLTCGAMESTVRKMAVRKACESFRLSDEQKRIVREAGERNR